MDFFSIGDEINVKDYNGLVYLLRKFKRLNTGLKLGALTLTSDYGSFVFDKALTSVGGNFIIEQEINVSSSDCLRNCFYSFVFSVIDVNTSGTVNKRTVKVTGGTGDDGTLFITLPTDLIESDEVILPQFELDIVFDEHEYYTPVVDVVNVELVSDKRFVTLGETATVTATLTDRDGELLVGVPCNFNVNGVTYSEITDENGEAEWEYTGTGISTVINIRVVTTRLTLYDSVMTATVNKNKVILGNSVLYPNWLISNGDVTIDWGDGTTSTVNNPARPLTHNYTDGETEHTIGFIGEITGLGNQCFYNAGLTSILIIDTVTSLGRRCFAGNRELTSISIPNSVMSIGEECFYLCPIVDYQLYWKDTAIIEYDSDKMPVNSNTFFTIPQGQRTQYLNKNYPNKIKIRGYDLSITTDKTIIETDETSTVTATLTYNMEPISDETVSYTIRQGATVIDTGSDTTDSNGEIEIEYTGTSIGKINIIFTYDTLTETSIIYDTINYDNATTTDHQDIWVVNTSAHPATLTRGTTYSTLAQQNTGTNGYMFHNITDRTNKIVEFDIQTTGTDSRVGLRNGTSVINVITGLNGKWNHIIIDFDNNIVYNTTTSTTKTISSSTINRIYFEARGNGESVYFKNFMVYGSSGSSKISTSVSLSSDKASYYTDESIVLSGVLVDDDSLPLVNASVKVYRGASLVDTVSTDSNGEYEKSVTGLSAGSYSFKAQYDGDDTYQASTSSTVSVIVQNHTYSLSISSDKQIILTTESITISGTLLKDSTAFSSQSVDLYDGVTKIATLTTDSDGEYEETVSGLSVGVHTFKAVNSNVESSTISITVNEPTHTYSLSIASDKQSILTTESVTISGQLLMDSSPYTGQSVALYDGSSLVDTLTTDSSGNYSKTVSGLSVGTHTFKAVNSNAESSTVSVTVTKITTTTSINASSSSILTTDTLTLTGSVTNVSTGSVKLYDGSTLVDEVSLSSGSYSKSLTGLSAGTHTYKAVYDGDTTHSGSESSTVTVTVSEPAPVHDYSLSVASSKDILSYADSESATLTATLLDNNVAVSGETLSYVIKHGSTTITTGSDTTDSSGQISFTYTATGVGDITVEVDYGILLQETYALQDLWYYNPNTYSTSSTQLNITLPSTPFTLEYTLKQGATGSGVPYLDIGNASNNRILVGQYARAGANGLIIYKSSSTTHAYSTNPTTNQENTIWFKADGSKYYYKLNDGVVMEVADAGITLSKIIHIEAGGSSSNYIKNIKVKAL